MLHIHGWDVLEVEAEYAKLAATAETGVLNIGLSEIHYLDRGAEFHVQGDSKTLTKLANVLDMTAHSVYNSVVEDFIYINDSIAEWG